MLDTLLAGTQDRNINIRAAVALIACATCIPPLKHTFVNTIDMQVAKCKVTFK